MNIYLDNCCYNRPYDDQTSIIIQEKFDYTKWQREYFDAKSPEEISAEASRFEQEHPFTGKAVRI